MTVSRRILLVSDVAEDEQLIRTYVPDDPQISCEIESCSTLDHALLHLATSSSDVTLLALPLTDNQGLDALSDLLNHSPTIPVIILTDMPDRTLIEQAIRLGAQDCLPKQTLTPNSLNRTIVHAVERNRIRQELLSSESRHRLLFESAPVSIGYFTPAGDIIAVNKTAARHIGKTPEEAVGMNVSEYSEHAQEGLRRISEAAQSSNSKTYEDTVDSQHGARHLLRSYAALRNADNSVVGVQVISSDITAQKNAEFRFQIAANTTSDLIYEWDLATDEIHWFGDIDHALGYPQGTIQHTPSSWKELVHPEDRARLGQSPLSHRTATVPIHQEYRTRAADGSWRYWLDRSTPVLDEKGIPSRWIGVCEDVTLERLATRALEAERANLESIFEAMPAFLYLQATDHTIPYANKHFHELFGDPKGQKCHQIFRSDKSPCTPYKTLQVLETRETIVREWTDDQGRVFELRELPFTSSDNEEYALVIGTEITALIRATEALRTSEKRFRELAEMLPEVVFECDLDGRLRFANRSALERFGYSSALLKQGVNAYAMLAPEDRARAREDAERIIRGEEIKDTQYTAIRGDGTKLPVIIHSSAIWESGQPVGLRGILVDISERVLIEQALERSESEIRDILDTVPDLMFQLDDQNCIRMYHAPAEKLYVPAEQFIGRQLDDILPKKISAKLNKSLRDLKQTGTMQMLEYSLPIQDTLKDYEARLIRGDLGFTLIMIRDVSANRQAQKALEMASDIFHSTPVGLFIYQHEDPNRFVLVDANPEAVRLTGITVDEWGGRELNEIWPEARSTGLTDAYVSAFKHDKLFNSDDLPDKNKLAVGPYRIRAFRIPDDRLVVSLEDMSAQLEAEKTLVKSEAEYRSLFENAPLGIFRTTPDGRILATNESLVQMLGYDSFEQLAQRNLEQEGYEPETPRALFKKKMEEEGRVTGLESAWTRQDGSTIFIREHAHVVRDDVGEIAYYEGSLEDITEQRMAELALQQSEESYRTIFESANDVILIHDAVTGQLLDGNGKVEEMYGYSVDDFLKLQVEDFSLGLPPYTQEEVLHHIHAAAAGEPQVFEWHCRRKNGELFWTEVGLRQMLLLGKRSVLAVVRDISERKRLEAQLRQGQKLESIGTLASGVAHEINNPLMGMINYAELISMRIKDESLKEFAEGIKHEGNRVAKIVRNLLTFSRQDQDEHSPARMTDIVSDSLSLVGSLLRKNFIQMEINIPEDLPVVRCRSQQIQQVVINLVTNARDSLNEKYVEADRNKRMAITSRVLHEGEQSWLRSTVEDFGNGISGDLVDRIFDPFFTTKPRTEGTGLGLSISYGIISDHKGRLTVESEPGQFTRFHVDLPLAQDDLA